jgi:hypothetical protein
LPAAINALRSSASPDIHDIPRAVPRKNVLTPDASSESRRLMETLGPGRPSDSAAAGLTPLFDGHADWQSWQP